MVVYGYKPDTLVAVYPTSQGTNAPRRRIFKNAAVYLADWLAENYCHYLKVRLIYQQLQIMQRAELVNFAPPCPHVIIPIIAPLVRAVEADFYLYCIIVCSFSTVSSITPVTIRPVKMHSQRLPINPLFTSVVFMSLKFTYYYSVLLRYPLVTPAAALVQRWGYRAEQCHIGVAVIVLVKCPSLECSQTEFHELFFSRCLGDAHPVSVK